MKRELAFALLLLGLAVILMSGIIIAQEDSAVKESKRNDFNARLSHIMCRIDLTKTQIDLLSGVDSNLTMYKEKLDADAVKLKEFADAMNHKEFGKYFTTSLKDNLKNAVVAIKDAKRDFKNSNLTVEEKKTLRVNHKAAITAFADCVNKADKGWGEKRAGHLNAWINHWNNVISKMKEKGYDTTEMEAVVSDAQSKLLPALEAIKSATTKEARKTAMENAKNLHLHLWARFEIARIKSYLNSVDDDAIAKGYQSEVDAINAKLTEAANLAVSGKKYKDGEFETVWTAIRDAAKMLKDLNKKLKA